MLGALSVLVEAFLSDALCLSVCLRAGGRGAEGRRRKRKLNLCTTLSNGYLGSRIDEERSELRYVLRIAELSESSNFRTHTALLGIPKSTFSSVSPCTHLGSVLSERASVPENERLSCYMRGSLEM